MLFYIKHYYSNFTPTFLLFILLWPFVEEQIKVSISRNPPFQNQGFVFSLPSRVGVWDFFIVNGGVEEASGVYINEALTDDELQAKSQNNKDKEVFELVCKRWLHLQSTKQKKLCTRMRPLMLRKMAVRFSRLVELDLSQSVSQSFYLGIMDSDLKVIVDGFSCLRVFALQHCRGWAWVGRQVDLGRFKKLDFSIQPKILKIQQ